MTGTPTYLASDAGRVAVNGIELAWTASGVGEPLVLVHGWTGSKESWAHLLPTLDGRVRTVAHDHRGHGASTHADDASGYTFDHLVADFIALVEALELPPFHLLGHSMGGIVAMRYALDHPAMVRSLVLMDTGAGPDPSGRAVMEPIIELVRAQGLAGYVEAARPYVPAEGFDTFERQIMQMDALALTTFAEELLDYESVLHRLGELTIPTTVMVGENDVGLRPPADAMHAAIPGSVLDVIPGAAHNPHLEDPDAWLASIGRHLDRAGSR